MNTSTGFPLIGEAIIAEGIIAQHYRAALSPKALSRSIIAEGIIAQRYRRRHYHFNIT